MTDEIFTGQHTLVCEANNLIKFDNRNDIDSATVNGTDNGTDTKCRYSLFPSLEGLCDYPENPPLVSIYRWFAGRLEREKPGRELQRLY
jgi:hypothetical protein